MSLMKPKMTYYDNQCDITREVEVGLLRRSVMDLPISSYYFSIHNDSCRNSANAKKGRKLQVKEQPLKLSFARMSGIS